MKYLCAFALLNILVVVHEVGHWAFAWLFRIRVTQVSLGFGPPMFTAVGRATRFVLGAIPVGLFLRFDEKSERSWGSAPAWRRGAVLLGGPFLNIGVGLLLLLALYLRGTHVPVPLVVGTVQPGSEAARAQIRPGDQLISIEGVPLSRWSDLSERSDKPFQLNLIRGGRTFVVSLSPRRAEHGSWQLGLTEQYVYREHLFEEAMDRTWFHARTLAADGTAQLKNPVSPAKLLQRAFEVAGKGWDGLLRLTASLSLALGLFYLLPVPGLDGGRMAFISMELIRGKAPSARTEALIHVLGVVVILGLCLAAAVSVR